MAAENFKWIKKYAAVWALFAVMLLFGTSTQAQQYWRVDNVGASINTANWGPSGGPYTNAYVAGTPIVFTANSNITYVGGTLVNNISVTGGATVNLTANLTYSTGGGVRTVDIGAGAVLNWNSQAVSIPGSGFIKNGNGTWNMATQTNAYTGGFTLNAGTVTISHNNSLGGGGGTIALNGGILTPSTNIARTIAPNVIIGGNFQIGDATNVPAGTGNVTFSGTVALGAATRTITVGSIGAFTFNGVISGAAGLTVATLSTGRIALGNAGNTYTGPTTINSGILQGGGVANCLPVNTALVFANTVGATFLLNGFNQTVGSIAGGGASGGNITLGANTLSTGGNNTSTSYDGVISGTGGLTKTGIGTQTLTRANTYSGATTVGSATSGSLRVNGSTSASSAAAVNSGGILGGSGTVAGTVAVNTGGTISPGIAASVTGTLNTGATTFASGSNYRFEISNVAGTQGAAIGWDFLNSSGAITLTGANPINILLTGVGTTGFNSNLPYTFVIATGTSIVGFNPVNFTVTPSGTISAFGTFAVEQSGNSIQVVYTPPSGNSISLDPANQLPAATFCNGITNNVITLTFVTTGTVTAPAIELSDAAGNFVSGTVQLAGTITGSGPYTITGTVPPGQTASAAYRVRVISADAVPVISGNNGNNITITNAVTPTVSIAITTGANPSCTGSNITFTATPGFGGSPGYQWKRNGVDIGGATAVTYSSTASNTGDVISCVLTTSVTCFTSATAVSNDITLTVNPVPANPGNPVAAGVNPSCGNNSLNSLAADPNTNFYWQGTVLNGQSAANETTAPFTVSASGTYYVTSRNTDGCWSTGSGSIVITVNSAPSISVHPVDRNISANGNTTFSVTAANATGYQWQVNQGSGFSDVVNGGVYAGATTSILTLTAVPISYHSYVYQCIVKAGACADLLSNPATLSVNPVPWEDFETGVKGAYTNGNVTCTAGNWAFNNALLGTSGSDYLIGAQSARIDVGGAIVMNFNLTTLGVVKLNHRVFSGDLNSTWQLQASSDNGTTWTAYTSPIFTSTSTVQTTTILINLLGNIRFRIVNLESSGNHRINIDDIYVTTYTGCTTPTSQATFTSVTALSTTSMTINFGAGTGGTGRIVVVKQGSPITGFPTSGVTYAATNNFSTTPATIATGEKVVYSGAGTSVNVIGLTANTTYYFQIYEYAGTNCYLVSNAGNTGVATTACNTPVTGASVVNASLVTTTTATLSWTSGSGTNRLVVVNAGSAVTGNPVNGSSYSANSSFSVAPVFTPGTGKIVYNSTSNTVPLTNLASNTVYHVSVFEFNNVTNCYVSTGATTTFTTGSLLSDIISANGESNCVSSIVNGAIATVANGTQVWQFSVRDGGSSAPDADALPTIVNSIVLTQGTGNTVADWTNIQAAALFDGATLIGNGVITGTNITFTGAPLVNVADNSLKTLSLRITLKNPVSIPATIDGRLFRFSITQANITLAGSGTSGKNTSAPVATTDITKDVVCVVATQLVFGTQPSNTGQNLAMSPSVVVTAYDANNNVDLDFTQSVTITSTALADLVGTPLTATAIAGRATFTGVKHIALGTFTMTAASSGFTNVVSSSYQITPVTTFALGDFAILAVNNNNTNNVDEIVFVVFKDILPNTSFYMTDNGYDRVNLGKWGTTEGIVQLTYTGAGNGAITIPAGTIFVIQGNNTSFTIRKCGANDNANWTISPNVLTSGLFNVNNNDQVWFTQGGGWTSAGGSLSSHDAVTSGTVLYGWTGINWKANMGNVAPTWTTQGSRLYPQMGCFSTNLNLGSDLGRYKYTGPSTVDTRLGWITRINNILNWTSYANNGLYDGASVDYAAGLGFPCVVPITPGVPVDGKWTGVKNVDWFDCNNWDTRSVPDATISVTIDATASNDCVVDNVTYSTNALQYGNAANAFNLTVNNKKLSTGNAADVINVNGNFILNNIATLDMTGGGTLNLQSGSWTKTASTFTSGTGTISYNSVSAQTIEAENYFNLASSSTGARLIAASIGIAGTFTNGSGNSYTFTNSTVDYDGSNQPIAAFTADLVTAGKTYQTLVLSGSGTKTLAGNTDVETILTLNNSVQLALGNNLLNLKSTAAKTASLGPVPAGASITYGASGRFVIERHIPAKRAWRLLTSPVTAATGQSISDAWREAATPRWPMQAEPAANVYNPAPGYGTHISGGTSANGYDQNVNGNASLKYFDGTNWVNLPVSTSLYTQKVTDYPGYMLFVRGSRALDLTNGPAVVADATAVRSSGRVNLANITPYSLSNQAGLKVVGNPFPSAIDFKNVTKSGTLGDQYYLWDPRMGGNFGVGAFVTFLRNGATYDQTLTAGGPYGGTLPNDGTIESGAAFMVNFGASGTLQMGENAKIASSSSTPFGRPTVPVTSRQGSLRTNLAAFNGDGSLYLIDGVLCTFSPVYNSAVDMNDAMKITTLSENIAIANGGKKMAIERREPLKSNDTIFLQLSSLRVKNYQFELDAKDIARGNLAGFVEDSYLSTSTSLNMNGITRYNFSVENIPGSFAANRFHIVFKKAIRFGGIKANVVHRDVAVEWRVENEMSVNRYEVERSADGETFTSVGSITAREINSGGAAYNWVDLHPGPGIYYYRIKGITLYDAAGYSEIVKVKITRTKSDLYVYPNPVTGGVIGLQMGSLPAGNYSTRLVNVSGQVLQVKNIVHDQGRATESITYPASLIAGTYQLEVTGPDKKKSVISILISSE